MDNRLFYLEDDQALAQLTIKALQRQGFTVEHFATIAEAKKALGQADFSHALLDMKLDDGNSLQIVSELISNHSDIKILLLTGFASIATAVQAIKLGAHNYLPKPASITEIITAFGDEQGIPDTPDNTMSLKRLEWEKIQQALAENDGNISLTAKQLNMHRRTLQRKLGKRPVSQ